ncbi:MAG TPA: hypothetical protein VF865_01675 [Acidobacteriaceae bacterium]
MGAQIISCTSSGVAGVVFGMGGAQKNVPFTAIVKVSFEQKLPEGNAIHTVVHTHEARDSAGRTRIERAQGCVRGADGQMHQLINITVSDPVTRTDMNWQTGMDSAPKVVHVFHMADRSAVPLVKRPEPTPADAERQQKMIQTARTQQSLRQREQRTEDLGTKDFNGVPAQGTRITRTIPAGEEGNDQPLVTVTEMWRSKELGLTMTGISDDPRRGRTVTEYEELNRGEPDAGLFSPPAGYTLQEQPQNGIGGVVGGFALQ